MQHAMQSVDCRVVPSSQRKPRARAEQAAGRVACCLLRPLADQAAEPAAQQGSRQAGDAGRMHVSASAKSQRGRPQTKPSECGSWRARRRVQQAGTLTDVQARLPQDSAAACCPASRSDHHDEHAQPAQPPPAPTKPDARARRTPDSAFSVTAGLVHNKRSAWLASAL
ncbi:hypothetical protein BC831DRAFT_314421 [Entophlyctis helioformis]|nr:hypothetical protein BC831DRAFT_314421 [Entophlyctis helioformis]